MAVGDYVFGTSQKEVMAIVSGQLIVTLPGEVEQRIFKTGESFIILANQEFKVTVKNNTAYLCT